LVRRQTEDYHRLANTPLPSEDENEEAGLKMTTIKKGKKSAKSSRKSSLDSPKPELPRRDTHAKDGSTHSSQNGDLNGMVKKKEISHPKPRPLRTKLKTTSMISYVDDRILTPELLRGMIFLYIGEQDCPNFSTDFFLSPLRAPEIYLREFPKVYMLTGEKDPLCDDTAIFAGRLRSAHKHQFHFRQELGIVPEKEEFDDKKYFEVDFIPGVSHGFLQFASVYPPAWDYIEMCSRWMKQAFAETSQRAKEVERKKADHDYFSQRHAHAKTNGRAAARRMSQSTEGSDNEDLALEMTSVGSVHGSRHHGRQGSGDAWVDFAGGNTIANVGDDAGGSGSGGGGGGSGRRRRSRGSVRKSYFDGRISPVATRTSIDLRSLRLSSPESLLERRMDGVATGLLGDDSRPVTPI
jgi:hypothetical protein